MSDKDTVYRQAAIDAVDVSNLHRGIVSALQEIIRELPSAQTEIIRCKDCKHWTQSMGKMKGYGLGRCDFHDTDLVTCNGYCYWAERRTDE